MTSTITARRLLRGNEIVEYPLVEVRDGHITSILSRQGGSSEIPDGSNSYPEALLVPAYLNIHVHGAVGHDVMEGTPEALQAIGGGSGRARSGSVLPDDRYLLD